MRGRSRQYFQRLGASAPRTRHTIDPSADCYNYGRNRSINQHHALRSATPSTAIISSQSTGRLRGHARPAGDGPGPVGKSRTGKRPLRSPPVTLVRPSPPDEERVAALWSRGPRPPSSPLPPSSTSGPSSPPSPSGRSPGRPVRRLVARPGNGHGRRGAHGAERARSRHRQGREVVHRQGRQRALDVDLAVAPVRLGGQEVVPLACACGAAQEEEREERHGCEDGRAERHCG